jgi:hypothetical protein
LGHQQSFHIPASEFHNDSPGAIWGKSESFPGEIPVLPGRSYRSSPDRHGRVVLAR